MCILCHQALTDEQVLEQINSKDEKFEMWNDTSISHLCIAYIGFNGVECSNAAKKKLEEYIEWAQTKPDSPDEPDSDSFLQTFFGHPTAVSVREDITKFTPIRDHIIANNFTKKQILEYLDSLDRVESDGRDFGEWRQETSTL